MVSGVGEFFYVRRTSEIKVERRRVFMSARLPARRPGRAGPPTASEDEAARRLLRNTDTSRKTVDIPRMRGLHDRAASDYCAAVSIYDELRCLLFTRR